MNRVVEIPNDLPADWPDYWRGSTYIDCGSHGRFHTTLQTPGHPAAIHIANFRDILSRWNEVWPTICETVTKTLQCPHTIHCPGAVMDIDLPDTPISQGAKWSVRFTFYKQPGLWSVAFTGWNVNVNLSSVDY